MKAKFLAAGCLAVVSVALVSGQTPARRRPVAKPVAKQPTTPQAPAVTVPDVPSPEVARQRAVVDQYCVPATTQKLKTANLLLDQLDLAHIGDHPEIGEKIVRKLRAGMMPPSGMPRPDPATREALITWMEKELDRHASESDAARASIV